MSEGSAEARDLDITTVLEVLYTMLTSKTKCFDMTDKKSNRLVTMTAEFMDHKTLLLPT